MYSQSLMQMASRVDQNDFFHEFDQPEAKERKNSCHEDQRSKLIPLREDSSLIERMQANETNSSKSAENSQIQTAAASQDNSPQTDLEK